jgi:Dolichyl-phosphate-mannose-protein mannosyltransferase
MAKIDITELTIYRWRYWIGYGLVSIGLIAALIFAGLYLPGGLSAAEMKSVVISDSIHITSPETLAIVDLPYHLLQKLSLALFGVSVFSIKLPSLILAFFSAIGLFLLLKRWFKPNIGVLASFIAITTSQFLFIAQDGTPAILYLFWSVWLILLATMISYGGKYSTHLRIAFYVMAALSLYTPLSMYMLIALASAIFLHPHLRFILKQLNIKKILLGSLLLLLISTPLILTIIRTPSLGFSLMGIPTQLPDFASNLSVLAADYLGFTVPGGSTIMTPFFELGSMLIILIGAQFIFKTKATAKSYVIIAWILCLLPATVLNPDFASSLFLPLVLLLAAGIRVLLYSWYDLFPLNPYARFAGLIPIVILVTVLIASGADRFMYGYRYDPNVAVNFSKDLKLMPKNTKYLLVSADEKSFYQVIANHNDELKVIEAPAGNEFLATRKAKSVQGSYVITKIITSPNSNDSDRFYLYTNTSN